MFYLHELILDMDADELVNSSALQTLLLRVTLWSLEPQSSRVRKVRLTQHHSTRGVARNFIWGV